MVDRKLKFAGLSILMTGMFLSLSGCIGYEPPKYDDAALGTRAGASIASRAAPSAGRIGLVINSNTEKSLQDSKSVHASLGSFVLVNTAAQQDVDPVYIHARILAALKRRYPTVDIAKDLSSSAAAGNAVTAVVDVRTMLGKLSGDKTKIDITLVFFDRSRRATARISAHGEGTIPYPAWDFRLQQAADQAVAELEGKL